MKKKSLIIVESPTKIKTLQKFLGDEYVFESSLGHIRDLPEKGFGIDTENGFIPTYEVLPDKKKLVDQLCKIAKKCDQVFLSPDPDREGEAIAWHIANILPENTKIFRATFNSITKEAVQEALDQPREIDQSLVNAQQARRVLDRIVGYKISPLLARRIQRGSGGSVSAGRVQSVALKLVVDREKEIEAFKPVEYWTISAWLKPDEEHKPFRAVLHSVDGKRWEKEPVEGKDVFLIGCKEEADAVLARMQGADYHIQAVEKKEKKRHPVPPFITSTLQQEASRHYGFSSSRTMSTAQSLYEGVDMGEEGTEGLITYMRTDSTRVAPEAVGQVRDFIKEKYGDDHLPPKPRQFTSKKSAQDAHEAIRPTNLAHPPEKVKAYLNQDQFRLYLLIWRRFVASQMCSAIYDTVSADIQAGEGIILRVSGSTIKFPGFLAVYDEKKDDEESPKADDDRLPHLEEGADLELQDLSSNQSFTKPPPRFTEASLVKELEKSGIGRPSTYASIMGKIQSRDYTVKENRTLKPTELGMVTAALLEAHFQRIMNVGFTVEMEDALEMIAEDKLDWNLVIRDFWADFIPVVETAEKEAFVPKVPTDLDCPKCGQKLQKVWAKSKYFYGCSGYPDCDYSTPIEQFTFDKADYAEGFNWDQTCPDCGSEMKVRHSRYGAFLGCAGYPKCRHTVTIPKKGEAVINPEDLPSCPAIDCPGRMTLRKSRWGKPFFSCTTYPDCDVIVNNLEDLESKYPNHPRTAYEKKGKKKAAGKKAASKKTTAKKTTKKKKTEKKPQRPSQLSPQLAEVCGTPALSRGEATKKLWEYIKANDLQDPKDKRWILPDAKLAEVFGGNEPVNMFKIAGLLSKHILGPAEEKES